MLQIRLLGQFDVRADGHRIVISSRAGQSLFAYLVLTAGKAHRREKLAGLFWPDLSDELSRRNLRNELWRVRKAIQRRPENGQDYLIADEFSLWFNSGTDHWLDVAALQSPSENLDGLISNLSLYQGELLPGFYEDWVLLERERLHARFENLMQGLLAQLIKEQRWTTVVEWSEKWIGLADTPEAAYRALMVAYAATGSRAQVASSYERVRSALDRELGVEPSSETCELYEQIMRGEAIAQVNVSAQPMPPVRLARPEEPPAPGEPPFKGLEYFDERDASLFFGREALIARLADRWRESAFLAVIVGASGSGKSSFVRAGLVPALRRAIRERAGAPPDWRVLVITPTAHPLEAVALVLTGDQESARATATLMDDLARDARSLYFFLKRQRSPTASSSNGSPPRAAAGTLLVVDQFEEIFTLCRDPFEREQFIDNLLYALNPGSLFDSDGTPAARPSPVHLGYAPFFHLVLTLRADFYAHLAEYSELRALFASHQEYIGRMTTDDMRRAIQEPAKQHGWQFDTGLVDLILRDVGSEPGALPLLSHALLETWKRRSGRVMTLSGYHDAGGVRGAIAHTAETAYLQLDPPQQQIARDIFLRLTELGEATEDTRRRATFDELVPAGESGAKVHAVLTALADVRLITLGETAAEVAHEAVIREWPRLREWLNEDRDGLRLHRQLTEAAREWQLLDRDPGALYRGARLAQARERISANPPTGIAGNASRMNALERTFLGASIAHEEFEQREHKERQQRELESAKRVAAAAEKLSEEEGKRLKAQAAANRQLRRRTALLAGAFVLALALAGLAWLLAGRAVQNVEEAKSRQQLTASRELAAAAVGELTVDPERSTLLALRALETAQTLEAENALHRAISASRVQLSLIGHADRISAVAFSPDAKWIATAGWDKTAKVWDARNGELLATLNGHTDHLEALAFNPTGTQIVTAGWDKTARIWDAGTGAELLVLRGHMDRVTGVAFSPNGMRIATSSWDGTVRIWDAARGDQLRVVYDYTAAMSRIAFGPDGKHIAVGFGDGTIKVWDAGTGDEVLALSGPAGGVSSVAFSPDGTRLAAAGGDQTVQVWDVASGDQVLELRGHTGAVLGISFSPDGAHIASTSNDGTIRIWELASGKQVVALYGHDGAVNDAAFEPGCAAPSEAPFPWCGTRLASVGDDRTLRIWDVSPAGSRELLTLPGTDGRFSADGSALMTIDFDGADVLNRETWQISPLRSREAQTLSLARGDGSLSAIAMADDGTHIATSNNNQIRIWDLVNGASGLRTFYDTYDHDVVSKVVVRALAFSPDGKRLADGSSDWHATVWDLDGNELVALSGHMGEIFGVSFNANGDRLVTAAADGTARIWDAATGKELFTLAGHHSAVQAAVFSPDGERVATGTLYGTAKIWDATTGKELFTLAGHAAAIQSLAFSPDGSQLATGSSDGVAQIWDVASGQERLTFSDQTLAVTRVTFSPDGTRLAVAGKDGSVRVYLLRVQELVQLARTRLTRTWTLDECKKYLHVETCPAR